ncbi:hypothetical protein SLS55_001646 [Diplodia seriata]|uniref:Uncharacterized protein n=1 Tax=Diplodia seriata TaxID=420778 RepID=A0A0G2H4T9_9PEZI|nr:hypothetical protein UCDDS831_g02791 [Diplodia seriata]OMP86743.1 hypothetical protein BK809_0000418 [Diplodia seriata]
MNPTHLLVRRRDNDADDSTLTPTMVDLLIALLVLVVVALVSVVALFLLRRARNAKKKSELPMYNEDRRTSRVSSHHRSLTITTAPPYSNSRGSAVYVYNEKETFMNEQRTPDSPVPEIRITFPEEIDEKGNTQSGKVVVVRVGDHSVGLEPLHEEQLPPYQKDENDRFQSLDLERIGGLKEKTNEKNEYSI